MSTATVEEPRTERQELILSGDAFAEKQKAAAKTEPPEVVPAKTEPEKKEPEKKGDAPEKKDETAAAKPEEKTKGKTPLDVAPVAKSEEKKEPAVEEVIAELLKSEPPANASASSKANHAAMRKGLERANMTIKTLSTQLQEAKSKTSAVPADVEERLKAAEAAVQERDALIERVAFEKSPRYQKFITEGEAELTAAKSYLEGPDAVKAEDGSAIDPGVIDLAARAKGSQRLGILSKSGMDAGTISAVTSHLARNDAIERERDAAATNWKTTHAEWTEQQKKEADARSATVRQKEEQVFTEVGKKMAETLAPFQRDPDNKEWNATVDSRLAEAKEYFEGKKSLAETSQIIYEGLAGRVYKTAFEDLRTKYNELVEETGRIKAARPGAADSSADTVTPVTGGDPMKIAGDAFEANRARHGV